MFEWISENWGTILVSLVLSVIVGLVIFGMIREKKAGKASCHCGCSGSCSGCPGSCACHAAAKKK
ncbi:MAG: FeoB-associated Cys-rich membrane protein [Lachnospiraceae bacterium]|nr:FeoB-associated Cys-rich membrane protein [Lachnospiraceae bacterium]